MPDPGGTLRARTSSRTSCFIAIPGGRERRRVRANSKTAGTGWRRYQLVANNGLLHSAVTQQKDRSTGATQSRRIGYCVTLTLRAELRSAREDLLCPFADSLDRGRKADLCLMFLAERGCAVTAPYHCAFSAHANGLLVMSVSIPNLNHCRLYRVHMVRIARPSSSFLLTIVTDRGRSCSRTWFRRA
jgi:hypothetical protein